MWKRIQAFKLADGAHAFGPAATPRVTEDYLARYRAAAEAYVGEPVALLVVDEDQAPEGDPQALVATIEDGQVVAVTAAEPPPTCYVHLELAAPAYSDDGVPLVAAGSEQLTATAILRATADPESPALEAVNRSYVLVLRRADTGELTNKRVTFSAGRAVVLWTPPQPTDYELRESDMRSVSVAGQTVAVRLVVSPAQPEAGVAKIYAVS